MIPRRKYSSSDYELRKKRERERIKLNIEELGQKLWCDCVVAFEGTTNGVYTKNGIERADQYLAAFKERFNKQ